MIPSLRHLLLPLLLLTSALASAADPQGRPEVGGSWLVRVTARQPFAVVLPVDERGCVLAPRLPGAIVRRSTVA